MKYCYLNNIYFANWLLNNNTLENKKDFFYYSHNNKGYIFNVNKKYIPTINGIFNQFYGGIENVRKIIINTIHDENTEIFAYNQLYFPLRELEEDELFYITMKYGKEGEYLLKDKYT